MAVAASQHQKLDGRITPYLFLTCLLVASDGLMYGYDLVVAGGVSSMNDFLGKFYPHVLEKKTHAPHDTYCKYKSEALQLFSSSLYLAALVSTFFASFISAKFGRKASILTAGLLYDLGCAISGAAQNVVMLILGRILLGCGVGFANQAVPVYLSEIAPPKFRGALNLLLPLNAACGILSANLANYATARIHPWGWRLSLSLAGIPALLLTFAGLIVVETPNSLIQRGQVEEAKQVLKKVRGIDNIEDELSLIKEAGELAKQAKSPYKSLLKPQNRPQLITAFMLPMFQQLSGNDAILFYGPVLFQAMGFKENSSLYSAVIIGTSNLLSHTLSIFTVDKLGRRKLLSIGALQMCIAQVIVAAILATQLQSSGQLPKAYEIIVVLMVCLFALAFGCSWGPLPWLIPSEIFPLETRSAGQSVAVFTNMLFKFVIAQSFLSMMCCFKYGTFLFFAGWVCIMGLYVLLLLPETKNIPIENMGFLWEKHWFWRVVINKRDDSEAKENVPRRLDIL